MAEQELKEAPTIIRRSNQICAKMSKSCALKVTRSFSRQDIPECLPSRRLTSIDKDPDPKLTKGKK
jgi:hypothetical protein